MAGTPKAQAKMDGAIGSAGKGHGSAASSPLQLRRRLTLQSTPFPTLPTLLPPRGQPVTMENLEATVQALMQKLAEQAQKLDEQAKTIAQWEGHQMPEESAAPPQQFQFSPGPAEEEDDLCEDWTERQDTTGPPPAPGTCTTTRPTAVVGGRAVAKKLGTSHQLVGVAMAPAMVEAPGGKIPWWRPILGSLVAQEPLQRQGPKTCTTALRSAAVVTGTVTGKSAGPKHLLRGFSPPHGLRWAGSIKAGIMGILGTPKALAGTSMDARMRSGLCNTMAGMIAVRAKIIHGVLPSTAWTAKMLRNLRPTMVISPSGCSGDPLSLDSSGARTPGGRRSSRELKSTKVR